MIECFIICSLIKFIFGFKSLYLLETNFSHQKSYRNVTYCFIDLKQINHCNIITANAKSIKYLSHLLINVDLCKWYFDINKKAEIIYINDFGFLNALKSGCQINRSDLTRFDVCYHTCNNHFCRYTFDGRRNLMTVSTLYVN